ncbi:3-oxoacyl-[acyl-carrier protein] reductase [Hydrogenispora ethanolica]|jgi:3-oxoacyl-[acyl-carrier protein] reductase|uniref:3-oxoacyl-[acyl-carrier protein] reductase n=1 Tax=Hydrogenispora ethanolica TaxID=1082276 RepID=A0A4R1RBA4_HYDET|nr:SDR family NAD(P)-dependent oxidoreductase [Hydrogenispora ethanolica]TCL62732.1 3-oxoacyl-[acyl-carrier protein] reductase [Hydrogenispora ethanolica]
MGNKVALVTGGVTGIGRAVVEAMVREGYSVALCDADTVRGALVEQELAGRGAAIRFIPCNVADEAQVAAAVAAARREYGCIDCLVNNAGIIRRRAGAEIKVSDWDEVFAVNTRGAFLFCREVADCLKEQGGGRIVNISSIAGKLGDITSAPGYGPSKAALDCLTKTFARELAEYGITVNGVAPHAIATEMSAQWSEERRGQIVAAIPLKRLGKPEEVAAAVMFLLSEGAGFITGEIIDVNGGFLMD